MTAPEQHEVLADGYCMTCGTVPCQQPFRPARPSRPGLGPQIDRLELKVNRLLRAAGLDPDKPEPPA